MTPIDTQVSRSNVKVEGQPYSLYVGEGALVFYKHLYLCFLDFSVGRGFCHRTESDIFLFHLVMAVTFETCLL